MQRQTIVDTTPVATEDLVLVVPTIRSECIHEFLDAWGEQLGAIRAVVIVEDNEQQSFEIKAPSARRLVHVAWDDIDRELADDAWIVPRRTDCVRSFGYLKALEAGARAIVTLDDDCFPVEPSGFFEAHANALNAVASSPAWVSTLDGVVPRGVPYEADRRIATAVINHGLWDNVPDYDAISQLVLRRVDATHEPRQLTVPRGTYFPMCGMNLSFRAELAPAMYFLLMGQGEPFDRFGDIWCGVLAKRIVDHFGWLVTSGAPHVDHRRASNVWANLRKETPGLPYNEHLWRVVDDAVVTAATVGEAYGQLADAIDAALAGDAATGAYWSRLAQAMHRWAELASTRLGQRAVDSTVS